MRKEEDPLNVSSHIDLSISEIRGAEGEKRKCRRRKAKCGKDRSSAEMIILDVEWIYQRRNDCYSGF